MKIINVVAAIIKKGNKVFIAERGYGEFKGKWEFPGGKIEPGETGEEAIVREIKEELKSDIEVEQFFYEINDKHEDRVFNVKFYICRLVKGDLVLTEHLNSKWVEPKHIVDADFMEADKVVLDELRKEND